VIAREDSKAWIPETLEILATGYYRIWSWELSNLEAVTATFRLVYVFIVMEIGTAASSISM